MKEHFIVLNSSIRFDGNCEDTRPYCGALCCKNQVILLTKEEEASGDYSFVSPTDGCNCSACQLMRSADRVALQRREGQGCVYLDGLNKCSIYATCPTACKDFHCESTWWSLTLHRAPR